MEMDNYCLAGTGFLYRVWDDEKVLEMQSGDSCTTLQMYLMPINSRLKNG